MVIPFDDHMVHRGHGIFDTAGIVNGKIYDLDAHLDRFLKSAERSKLKLPGTAREMRDIIIRTTAASGGADGLRSGYWLSSGTGNLDLTPVAGADPGFFVMIFPGLVYSREVEDRRAVARDGRRPIRSSRRSTPSPRRTNYLPNVLMQMEAKEKGFDNGVFIDHDGHVGESSNTERRLRELTTTCSCTRSSITSLSGLHLDAAARSSRRSW
jgi:4-amino-4-deoxychorismate lyase